MTVNANPGRHHLTSLLDARIELQYTALNGGPAFADSVRGLLKPYNSCTLLSFRYLYADELNAFISGASDAITINVARDSFPNMAGDKLTSLFCSFETIDDKPVSLIMNDDTTLVLGDNKLLLTDLLSASSRGQQWLFKMASGQYSDLQNINLVVGYKAKV